LVIGPDLDTIVCERQKNNKIYAVGPTISAEQENGHISGKSLMNSAKYRELSDSSPVYAGVGGVGWLYRSWSGAYLYGK
jgi:hypothetical protein